MTTKGFVSFIAKGQAKNAYSHCDSGPDDLGIKVLHWLRSAATQPGPLAEAITRLKLVSDDDALPTEAQRQEFAAYYEPTGGGEWYSLLHATQGEPEEILRCGYVVDEDDPFGWIYEVDSDEQTFSVIYDDDYGASWPWSALPTDSQFLAKAHSMSPEGEWGVAYLIRPASQGARLRIPADSLAEVLTPPECEVRPSPGYGNLHLQGDGFEISFSNEDDSDEDDSCHVIIEGNLANLDTDELAAQVARQIEHSTQTATEWLRYIPGAGGWVHVR
jgi:hypothetical protein